METDDDDHLTGGLPHPLAGAADWQRLMQMRRYMDHQSSQDMEDDDDSAPNPVEYDEEGVRKPDRVRVQRLLGPGHSQFSERSVFGRADDPSIDWLFPPPRHLSFQESLENVNTLFFHFNIFFLRLLK
jgi:hypothetical protein